MMAKTGHPTKFTQALVVEICERLSVGEPLAVICRDDHMPCVKTVWEWQNTRDEVATAIARARVDGFDMIAAECLVIANTPIEGMETTEKADGAIETKRGDMLGHRKLQIDTRLKLLSKWDPKRYGDKMDVTLDGKVEIDRMTDEELNARIAALAAKGGLK